MNTRPLQSGEEAVLTKVRLVAEDYALLFLTRTGLEKSILDATAPFRTLLKTDGFHDFLKQPQGIEHRVKKTSIMLLPHGPAPVVTSLYRPITKNGDPRIWFSSLGQVAKPNDVLALFIYRSTLHAINLTLIARKGGVALCPAIAEWLETAKASTNAVAQELLELLRALSRAGPMKSVGAGDTSIGRTLEAALGIPMNSKRTPDFKGIEIKSARQRKNRHQLFAQVPDWSLSPCKSFNEILTLFGYETDGHAAFFNQ